MYEYAVVAVVVAVGTTMYGCGAAGRKVARGGAVGGNGSQGGVGGRMSVGAGVVEASADGGAAPWLVLAAWVGSKRKTSSP